MPVVALLDSGLRIGVSAGALRVEQGGITLQHLQPHEVDELHLHGKAEVTTEARALLLRAGIEVLYFGRDGRCLGRTTPESRTNGSRRLQQYRVASREELRLPIARAIVAGKLNNQYALLYQRNRNLRDAQIADALAALRAARATAARAPDLDTLRGVEGAGAARYFEGFAAALTNPAFRFTGRNRRPPRDPPNACLSFGYALLFSGAERALRQAGLDPSLGLLHETDRGRASLALDLMEELRPAVDGVVLTLLNRRQLGPEDFRSPTPEELGAEAEWVEGAVYLDKVARAALIRAWEQRLDERSSHPLRGDAWTLRDLLLSQSRQLAQVIEGARPAYEPVAL